MVEGNEVSTDSTGHSELLLLRLNGKTLELGMQIWKEWMSSLTELDQGLAGEFAVH